MADENLLSEEKLNKLHMHVEKCNPKDDINNLEIDRTAFKVNHCINKIFIKNNFYKYNRKI